MTVRPVIAIFGISGVGKTTLISEAADSIPGALHLQASALIKQGLADPAVTSDMLRRSCGDRIIDNQAVLIEMFELVIANAKASVVFFDGHLVIDTDDRLLEIPIEVIAALKPNLLVHIEDDAETIALRRASDRGRQRPVRSIAAIADHQSYSRSLCKRYSSVLGIKMVALPPGALDEFRHACNI